MAEVETEKVALNVTLTLAQDGHGDFFMARSSRETLPAPKVLRNKSILFETITA